MKPNPDVCLYRYVPHKGALDAKQAEEFVSGIRTGGLAGSPIRGELAQLKSIDPWDGKEAKVVEEEEFSLKDIMGDEL
jgi:hypothetical protein